MDNSRLLQLISQIKNYSDKNLHIQDRVQILAILTSHLAAYYEEAKLIEKANQEVLLRQALGTIRKERYFA